MISNIIKGLKKGAVRLNVWGIKTSQERYDIRPQSKGISEKASRVQTAVTTGQK